MHCQLPGMGIGSIGGREAVLENGRDTLGKAGVGDGFRTRDFRIHNPALYP